MPEPAWGSSVARPPTALRYKRLHGSLSKARTPSPVLSVTSVTYRSVSCPPFQTASQRTRLTFENDDAFSAALRRRVAILLYTQRVYAISVVQYCRLQAPTQLARYFIAIRRPPPDDKRLGGGPPQALTTRHGTTLPKKNVQDTLQGYSQQTLTG